MLVGIPREIKAHEYRVGLTGSVEISKDRHFLALVHVVAVALSH
jgi:alanine dehydrogenase